MIDYLNVIRAESARFRDVVAGLPASARVPACPGWSVADLIWHLAEVQYFWASIVAQLLDSPESVTDLERPDEAELPSFFDKQAGYLIEALEARRPGDVCWSWHGAGRSVGWVLRRQAHEALIHRVDAELAAGGPSSIDVDLATDGVDEILSVMMDASDLPNWGVFTADETPATIQTLTGVSWSMVLGRFTGTSPNTGNAYDDAAIRLAGISGPTTVITGPAADLDLWLWGRGQLGAIETSGDGDVVAHIREAAAAATQ